MRLFTLINACAYSIYALIYLVRLGIPDGWPIIMKYKQWHFVVKLVATTYLALWGFWIFANRVP